MLQRRRDGVPRAGETCGRVKPGWEVEGKWNKFLT